MSQIEDVSAASQELSAVAHETSAKASGLASVTATIDGAAADITRLFASFQTTAAGSGRPGEEESRP